MNRILTSLLALLMLLGGSAEGQVLLRYGANIDSGWGDASAVITPYVKFPRAFVAPYSGNRITKVGIGLCKQATNVYLYIKNSPQDTKPLYRQKIESLKAGWNEVTLDTPFDISGSADITIGYKASFAEAGGVGYSQEIYGDGDFIYYNTKNKWTSTGHSICINATVEGSSLPQNELLISNIASQTAPYDAPTATFNGWVRNVGGNSISGYSLCYSFDGEERVMDINHSVDINQTDSFSIQVPSTDKGSHQLWVAVDMVNGEQDAYLANDTARATLTVRDIAFRRRVVCEEYTGLWCGFCPRGLVGMELMKDAYPGQFIAISAHGGDALQIADTIPNYAQFIASCSGAPMCNTNRRMTGDPYNDIQRLFSLEQAGANHIAYSLSARWNADSTAVNVESDVYSDTDIRNANYNIAYTVTEDSITGYTQTNYYTGNSQPFYGWEKKGGQTSDVVFNDVARAVYPDYGGEVCICEPMTAGVHYSHKYTVPVPPNVADRRNIHIVGQVIENSTGYIANAMSVKPEAGTATGIQIAGTGHDAGRDVSISRQGRLCTVRTDGAARVDVYSAEGMLVDSQSLNGSASVRLPESGMSIVRVVKDGHAVRTFKFN